MNCARRILVSLAGVAAIVLPTPVLASGDDASVNRQLVRIANDVESAGRASSLANRAELLRSAHIGILSLIGQHSGNTEVRRLATGESLGNVSIKGVREELEKIDACEDEPGRPTYHCSLAALEASITREGNAPHPVRASPSILRNLAIASAIAGDFGVAQARLQGLLRSHPPGSNGEWAFFQAGSEIACTFDRRGFRTESDLVLYALEHEAQDALRPQEALEQIVQAQACRGEAERALHTARDRAAMVEDEDRGERVFVLEAVGIAERLLHRGDTVSALQVLDEAARPLLKIDRRENLAYGKWAQVRSSVVEVYSRIGTDFARNGADDAAKEAFDNGVAVAEGSNPANVWTEIGKAALENLYGSSVQMRSPAAVAERAVLDLSTLARAMHATGIDALQPTTSALLEKADRAAAEEVDALARLAAAWATIGAEETARVVLAEANEAARIQEYRMRERSCQEMYGGWLEPGCIEPVASAWEPVSSTVCAWWIDHAAFAAAYRAIGEEQKAAEALSCGPETDELFEFSQWYGGGDSNLSDLFEKYIETSELETAPVTDIEVDLENYYGWDQLVYWPTDHDQIRSRYVRLLIEDGEGLEEAADVAAGIVDAEKRVDLLIETAARQIESGMVRDARESLALAVATADELMGDSSDAQFGALRHSEIVILLALALWVDG